MDHLHISLPQRLRRIRYKAAIRDLVRETELNVNDLVYPIFVKWGQNLKLPIASIPGQFQFSIDRLEEEIHEIISLGIKAILLFGIPEKKDSLGSDAYHSQGIVQQAIRKIKTIAPELLIISDICFCQYMEHGHCGVIEEQADHIHVHNDKTLALLAKQVVSHAEAGSDVLAPAGMIDGMVKIIREALDQAGYHHLPILSYSVKYRSAMYGPFGAAAEGAAKIGDRRTYQMDASNSNEAMREVMLDIEEGADILMIKPAHTYLDIIYRIKQAFPHMPLAGYQVSGEYAMLKAAFMQGWLEEKRTVFEVLTAIKRAGADFILTYFAKDVARWLREEGPFTG